MRATLRLLANVKPARYLEPFTPTGLTGLSTHPSPRPTLIYLYTTTLQKLKAIPESSVYRKSTEALTKHRLDVVQSTKPPGFDAWLQRVRALVAENPGKYKAALREDGTYAAFQLEEENIAKEDELWGGDTSKVQQEGAYLSEEEMEERIKESEAEAARQETPTIHWEAEPALEAAQISEIENKIGGGLIEEVIQVAEGELRLVDEMVKGKVWEELVEKPKPGQWTYFERTESSS
ncbi:NADH-ubiquinone oxidoreductase 299 kDa subunit [Trichophyton tonsurans CBS 112818]|uniref:NADH-ubiquinone oxidoreductase 299 kDa subunit n=2 Tax=Trichophyton TaxID=5550 RepID=F2PWN1_TRIEC|nr:NADH-ubiquinone oxidoreductase 299 kDa subunit [Trichophyton tonsurans CBS 112818]EGE06299.1 NADH-ubiquinone oxidoreductase 299 kDa subunit [Trichophyton equinum CBS 127.97]